MDTEWKKFLSRCWCYPVKSCLNEQHVLLLSLNVLVRYLFYEAESFKISELYSGHSIFIFWETTSCRKKKKILWKWMENIGVDWFSSFIMLLFLDTEEQL